MMTLEEVGDLVAKAEKLLLSTLGQLPDNISIDSSYALGLAAGHLSRARDTIELELAMVPKEPPC